MWSRLLAQKAPVSKLTSAPRLFRAAFSTASKPFERVLIANRGEIASRVMRTCQALDIETIAIYSTADSQAPFVQEADTKICVGPADSSASYLNVDAVLKAIDDSGAQAVHPGYGFLSENCDFATAITNQTKAVWLGPPPSAVLQMGDKLMSKELAEKAGVSIIPGHDKPVESIEEALQLCHEKVPYPVLLKAAAGGGGKGMRVCYNDQDLKESWGIAKSEAKKFFSDDRLLLEKFIEEPHHIEFQVLCSKNAEQVAIFPERECSIQRRNQKVIEETPSVLLTDATRNAMAEQVKKLCQTVGYESAGTVEFLVDANQGFYFLEMNTRLQVEHPVSEAVCGVDLVKGMLWVGAGWGLPEEFHTESGLILPYKGHAIEARIYAEDPLRSFLPSTGPLVKYFEPSMAGNTPERYLRMESGVAHGHVISPHYDPMISKIIYYAPTRKEAIEGLSEALDEYVIDGVQHNARLVQSVLREEDFKKGDTPTSFLPTHYPNGWKGVPLSNEEEGEFAVAAASIGQLRRKLLHQPALVGANGTNEVVVKMGGLFGTPYLVRITDNTATVRKWVDGAFEKEAQVVQLDSRVPIKYEPERCLAFVSLNGKTRPIQVINETTTGETTMQMYGADRSVLIQTVREHELSAYMHVPLEVDTTDLVISPMPGTLISYAVKEGQHVEDHQELCIVEAMKMQNIIRSPREGVIASLKVKVGASLKADQVIIEFEKDEEKVAEVANS